MAKKFILTLECGHQTTRTYIPKQAICDRCKTAQEVVSYDDADKPKKVRPKKPGDDDYNRLISP